MERQKLGQNLLMAVSEGNQRAVSKILSSRVAVDLNVFRKGDSALHLASRKGMLDVVKQLIRKGDNPNKPNQNGNYAVYYAAKYGYLDIVEFLKNNGANLNIKNEEGDTALHAGVNYQSMDVIEKLVQLGMNFDSYNKEGYTPLHIAVMNGRQEAMEALLISGARPNTKDFVHRRNLEELCPDKDLSEQLRIYTALAAAREKDYVLAKGLKLTQDLVREPKHLERVNMIIQSIDIPPEFPTAFYCRRERSENSRLLGKIELEDAEHIFSDIFYIKVGEVSRDCAAEILLPVYTEPSKKEELVLKFVGGQRDNYVIEQTIRKNKDLYCSLSTTLTPETFCTCVVVIRPRRQDCTVNEEGTIITSHIDNNVTLAVPPEAFSTETVVSMKIFGSTESTNVDVTMDTDDEKEEEANKNHLESDSLLTDVYEFSIKGEQPTKQIEMQIPLCDQHHSRLADDMVIVCADENNLADETSLEICQAKPRREGQNIVFEISHFCIYTAIMKKELETNDGKAQIVKEISNIRDRKKSAVFISLVKQTEGARHVVMVECALEKNKKKRVKHWEGKGYEVQEQETSQAVMAAPNDNFGIDVTGHAEFESTDDRYHRKLSFLPWRYSNQPYQIVLKEGAAVPTACIKVYALTPEVSTESKPEVIAEMPVKLHFPPPKTARDKLYQPNAEERKKNFTTCRQS